MLKRPPRQPALSLTSHRCLVSGEAASGPSTELKLLGKAELGRGWDWPLTGQKPGERTQACEYHLAGGAVPSGQWGQRARLSGDGQQAKSQAESWSVGSAVLAEGQGSVPNTYMVNHNMVLDPGDPTPSSDLSRYQAPYIYTHTYTRYTDILVKHPYI